jgi:hypothetical protein
MRHATIVIVIIVAAAAAGAIATAYLALSYINRPQYALEVDATRDTTDISGTLYRIRIVNAGTERLTGIKAEMGRGDVQTKDFLDPGETYFFYPDPDTLAPTVRVTANEGGIDIVTDYRTPAKTIGLPGAGR